MEFFKNFDWSAKSFGKIVLALLLGTVTVAIAISLVGMALNTIFNRPYRSSYDMAYPESTKMELMKKLDSVSIDEGNSNIPQTNYDFFEIKEYSAHIETRKLQDTCTAFSELKKNPDIIFETSNEGTTSCSYSFKVTKGKEDVILELIESYKPQSMNASIHTIQKVIEEYDNKLNILTNKLSSVEETLEKAQNSYDEITVLATKQQDIENLTKIIENKLNLIEKLSKEQLSIKEQIDQYNKEKNDQLNRLNYTYFSVSIRENLIINLKEIFESWKAQTQQFVRDMNGVFQGVTVKLMSYVLHCLQAGVYIFISLFLLKILYILVRKLWK
jgi:hypothetical protein